MVRALLAVLCLLTLTTLSRAETLTPERLTTLTQANVIIGSDSRGPFCSGSVIDAIKRLILTAAHCVDQQFRDETRDEVDPKTGEVTKKTYRVAEDLLVWQNKYLDYNVVSSHRLTAKILSQDKSLDQALIQLNDPDYRPPISLDLVPPDHKYLVSTPCFVIGNSFGILDASVSACTIAAPQRTFDMDGYKRRFVQLNSGAVGGNSGGAVIDAQTGRLLGTLVAGYNGSTVTFMVPITIALDFIKSATPK